MRILRISSRSIYFQFCVLNFFLYIIALVCVWFLLAHIFDLFILDLRFLLLNSYALQLPYPVRAGGACMSCVSIVVNKQIPIEMFAEGATNKIQSHRIGAAVGKG